MYGKFIQKIELLPTEGAWRTNNKEKSWVTPTHKHAASFASCYRSQTLHASLVLPVHFCLVLFVRLVPAPGSGDGDCPVGMRVVSRSTACRVRRAEGTSCLAHEVVLYSQQCWGPWRLLEEQVLSDSHLFFTTPAFSGLGIPVDAATAASGSLMWTKAMLASNPGLEKVLGVWKGVPIFCKSQNT